MSLADAAKRAAASTKPAPKPVEKLPDAFELAAEELASAKTPGERAEVLRTVAELARLQK